MFELVSDYVPSGDQPKAIEQLLKWFSQWKKFQTLLWATGTGKTFTIANVIQKLQKPTLLISHNKTLAAQLATELKYFFPNNAVHYFVSYFDYYQPESYLPDSWIYIEKEATINQEIEMYRLATMASLLSRKDVIVVASASSLYGLWQKRFFQENCLHLTVGQSYDFKELKKQLLRMQYKPIFWKIEHGMFEFRWEILDIFSSTEKFVYRCIFNEDVLEKIEMRDSLTFAMEWDRTKVSIWPATQYLQDVEDVDMILDLMNKEKDLRVEEFTKKNQLVEAERIKKRVEYDIRMIRETWFVNGIENYSLYFDRRLPWEPPNTIFDYFPDDMLLIIDESHMTIPQLQAMPWWDRSRKRNLIQYWFRLPSAIDHRPLNFEELQLILWWKDIDVDKLTTHLTDHEVLSDTYLSVVSDSVKVHNARRENQVAIILQKQKKQCKTVCLSATPAEYELTTSQQIVEQLIRPTWLLDPITYVYPKSWAYDPLLASVDILLEKKPHLKEFMEGYSIKDAPEEVFWE